MTWRHVNLLVVNLITLGRLLAVPVAVWLILSDRMAFAFWLFVAAGVSDALDGFIARQFDARTTLGGYLDTIADKSLLVSVYITLGVQGYIAAWLVILVVFRDALIVFGVVLSHLLSHPVRIEPLFISKVNTVAQFVLAAAVMARAGLNIDPPGLAVALVLLVAITTLGSGAAYLVRWGRVAAETEGEPR
ncbi:MAG: CDP-alcohol phosphatidyltransferase family protein [Kiloniellales bacterium]